MERDDKQKALDAALAQIEKQFGKVRFVETDKDPDGFGFVTKPLAEKEFDERIKNVPQVLGRIRIEGTIS